jgi:hypothetical protein
MQYPRILGLCFFLWLAPAIPAADSLVGWWTFNEGHGTDAYDKSRMGNHGKLQGGCSFTQHGLSGSAIDFTCLDGQVAVNHNPMLEPHTGTIQAWLRIPMRQNSDVLVKTSNIRHRTGYYDGVYQGVYGLQIQADGSAKAYVLNDDPTTPGAPWRAASAPPGSITVSKWHHLVLRWDGARVAIFVDGDLKAHTPYDPIPGTGLSYGGHSGLVMGQGTRWGDSASHELLGTLDNVRFYNYARSNTHILNDYHQRGSN